MDCSITYWYCLYKLYSTYFSFLYGKRNKENRIFSLVICGGLFSHSRCDLSLRFLLLAVLFSPFHHLPHPLYDDCRFIPDFSFRIFERCNFVRQGCPCHIDNSDPKFFLMIVGNSYKFKGASHV